MGVECTDSPDDDESSETTNRRRFLVGIGSLGVVGVAGCTADGDDDDTPTPTDGEGSTPTDGGGSTPTDTPTDGGESTPTDTPTDGGESTPTDTATSTATPVPVEFPGPPDDATLNVLAISFTKGFRHASIENGHDVLEGIVAEIGGMLGAEVTMEVIDNGDERGVDNPQEAIPSTVEEFEAYDVVVFQNSTGPVLNETQKSAFREYIENGGNYMGIHAGSDTHKNWDWYENTLLGGVFQNHGGQQVEAETVISDHTHPSTKHLDDRWTRADEWYTFTQNPSDVATVLGNLDKSTFGGPQMDGVHPTFWYNRVGDGRMFYTSGGHNAYNFDVPEFQQHLKGGLMWAAGYADMSPAAVSVASEISFEDPIPITNEQTLTMTVTVENRGSAAITDGQALLSSNSEDITVAAASGARFDTIDAGGSHTAEWDVTISGDAEGEYTLPAAAVYTADGTELVTRGTVSFTIE
jgi:type 1 glutamine amidotransferase